MDEQLVHELPGNIAMEIITPKGVLVLYTQIPIFTRDGLISRNMYSQHSKIVRSFMKAHAND
jgi:hypothetical protein